MELEWPRRKIVHGKYKSYRKTVSWDGKPGKEWNLSSRNVHTGRYQLWPYHGQFQRSVGGQRSQTERGWGVMRKWQKELSRGCSFEETVTRERQDRAHGRERTAWEDYFFNWVCFYAKGEHSSREETENPQKQSDSKWKRAWEGILPVISPVSMDLGAEKSICRSKPRHFSLITGKILFLWAPIGWETQLSSDSQ